MFLVVLLCLFAIVVCRHGTEAPPDDDAYWWIADDKNDSVVAMHANCTSQEQLGYLPVASTCMCGSSICKEKMFCWPDRSCSENATETGFIVPTWETRCEINQTRFVPECLPKELYPHESLWRFAEMCTVPYASAKLANHRKSRLVRHDVYDIMFNNVITAIVHLVQGIAFAGIVLPSKKSQEKQGEGADEASSMFAKLKKCGADYIWLAVAFYSCVTALFSAITPCLNFWTEFAEYWSGVSSLPSHDSSFSCKSILMQQSFYYKDMLGYLVLTSFTVVDVFLLVFPVLLCCCLSCNVGAQCLVQQLLLCWSLCWSCICSFFTCGWVVPCCTILCTFLKSMCLGCVHFLCCGWLSFVWQYLQELFECICLCSWAKYVGHCCWALSYYLTHISWYCLCNCSIVKLLVWAGIIIVVIYFAVGIFLWLAAMVIVLMMVLIPVLLIYWVATQLVTGVLKALMIESERPFADPITYFGSLFDHFRTDVVNTYWPVPVNPGKAMKDLEEAHHNVPSCMADTAWGASFMTTDRHWIKLVVPIGLILALVTGNLLADSALSVSFVSAAVDDQWLQSETPVWNISLEYQAPVDDLLTVAGVRVPPSWPRWRGCECRQCSTAALIESDADFSCAPRTAKVANDVPIACQEEAFSHSAATLDGRGGNGTAFVGEPVPRGMLMSTPVFLNTFKLEAQPAPRDGCYGVSSREGLRLNGWCDCSSKLFVPAALDVVTRGEVSSVIADVVTRGKASSVVATEFRSSTMSSESTDHMIYNWQLVLQEEVQDSGNWPTSLNMIQELLRMETDLFRALITDSVLMYFQAIFLHLGKTLNWLRHEFYTMQNFYFLFTDWLNRGRAEDFHECEKVVLFGRSMSSLMAGVAIAITKWRAVGGKPAGGDES